MKFLARLSIPLVVFAVVRLAGAPAFATAVPWANETGSNPRFGWSDGQSDDGGLEQGGLWGDPTVTEHGFFFEDMNDLFKAEAAYPASDNIASSLSVTIDTSGSSPPGAAPLSELRIREWGSFTGDIEDVDASGGTVLLLPISPSGTPTELGQLTMAFDIEEHTWEASMDILFADIGGTPPFPPEVSIFGIDITNHLQAIPLDGAASIQKLGAEITLPEPATLGLVLCGFLPIVLRRAR
jgi:hypothetical protein